MWQQKNISNKNQSTFNPIFNIWQPVEMQAKKSRFVISGLFLRETVLVKCVRQNATLHSAKAKRDAELSGAVTQEFWLLWTLSSYVSSPCASDRKRKKERQKCTLVESINFEFISTLSTSVEWWYFVSIIVLTWCEKKCIELTYSSVQCYQWRFGLKNIHT